MRLVTDVNTNRKFTPRASEVTLPVINICCESLLWRVRVSLRLTMFSSLHDGWSLRTWRNLNCSATQWMTKQTRSTKHNWSLYSFGPIHSIRIEEKNLLPIKCQVSSARQNQLHTPLCVRNEDEPWMKMNRRRDTFEMVHRMWWMATEPYLMWAECACVIYVVCRQ